MRDHNQENRQQWLRDTLASLPNGSRLLDAGAGELRNRPLCEHLEYVSQDFNQYDGTSGGAGLHHGSWDTSRIDLVSDIADIPEPDNSFDVILCSEVLEHIPEPIAAIKEFARLLRPGGQLVMTAPFSSLVHFAPYHYCSGFSRYWYEHHLPKHGFRIDELSPNGDWFDLCRQEIMRLARTTRRYGSKAWPAAYLLQILSHLYFKLVRTKPADDLACFGWHVLATKEQQAND